MSKFIVVERVGRAGERDVVRAPGYRQAFDEMRARYKPDEIDAMSVAIAVETEEGRTYEL